MKLEPVRIKTERLELAGLHNGVKNGIPIIALHGWLDNAASFLPLATELEIEQPFYAMELPGHGLSEHRPKSCTYHLLENIVDVAACVKELAGDSEKVVLVGHSLGGIICSLYSASSPERVEKLVLLDSLGPLTDETSLVLPQLKKAMKRAALFRNSKLTVYPSRAMAAKVRTSGVGHISLEAAQLLVDRGIKEVEGGFTWTSDPRLMEPSLMRFSEEQVEAIFNGIECPVSLICGSEGYFSDYEVMQKRLSYIPKLEKHHVPGGHHFHMEGDVAGAAKIITDFLN